MNTHLIFTTSFDPSCDEVIDWIRYHNSDAEILRVNVQEIKARVLKLDEGNILELPSNPKSDSYKYSSIWFRKQAVFFERIKQSDDLFEEVILNNNSLELLNYTIVSEVNALLDFESLQYNAEKTLGQNPKDYYSKLVCLKLASRIGLRIPKTIVTRSKHALTSFYTDALPHGIICKAITEGVSIHQDLNKEYLANYTEEVSEEVLKRLPSVFQASLFQQKIEKDFEVRTFLIDHDFYSIAIFSQNNQQTATDFRRYDYQRPTRTAKFSLPSEVEKKLLKLANELRLNTGSFDLIKATDGEFYFLEVNPSGQFNMVSKSSGYYLEERIAKFLIE